MVQLNLYPRVVVSGQINGHPVHDIVKPSTAKPFILTHPGEKSSTFAALGCDDEGRGLRFSVVGSALIHLGKHGVPAREESEGSVIKVTPGKESPVLSNSVSGIVTDEVRITCADGGCHPDNELTATYEPGLFSSFFGLRK